MPDMDLSHVVAYFGQATGAITRRRMTGGGGFSAETGHAVAPTWTETAHEGVVVVPMSGEQMRRVPEGTKTDETRRVFWPAADGLRAASVADQVVEDQIRYLGHWWKVEDIDVYDELGEYQDVAVVRVGRA